MKKISVAAVILAALFMAASLPECLERCFAVDFCGIGEKCGPAVVNINTERKASGDGGDDFFGEMFRNMPPASKNFSNSLARIQAIGGNRTTRPMQKTKISWFGIFCLCRWLHSNQ